MAFAEQCAVNGRGHVISLDIEECTQAYDLIMDEMLLQYVTFLKMDSLRFLKTMEGFIDILFIDGLHTEKQVLKELEGYIPYMSEDSYIILHDTNNPAHLGVDKARQKWSMRDTHRFTDWEAFDWYNNNGLTVLHHNPLT